jgi:hypothetical protein
MIITFLERLSPDISEAITARFCSNSKRFEELLSYALDGESESDSDIDTPSHLALIRNRKKRPLALDTNTKAESIKTHGPISDGASQRLKR